MAHKIRIQLADVVHEIDVRPVDRVKLERATGQGNTKNFSADNMHEETLFRLAFIAAKRTKAIGDGMEFEAFLEALDDIEDSTNAEVPPPLAGTNAGTSTA